MIMQQGTRAFDPSTKVGKQMIETLRAHTTLSKQQIKQELIHYMTYMKLKDPQSLLKHILHVVRWDASTYDDCTSISIET